MRRIFFSQVPARALLPFLERRMRELRDEPQNAGASGERAAYTRLFLMSHLPFRSLVRLRSHCEAHAGLTGNEDPYSEGLGRGYRRALVEIERTLGERRPPIDA